MAYPTTIVKKLLQSIKTIDEALDLLKSFYIKCKDIDIISNTFNSNNEIIIKYLIQIDIYNKKPCGTCKIWKHYTEFDDCKVKSFGVSNKCKICTRLYNVEYNKLHVDKIKQTNAIYVEANRESLNIKHKQYYALNGSSQEYKDKKREYDKVYSATDEYKLKRNKRNSLDENKIKHSKYKLIRNALEENKVKRREYENNRLKTDIQFKIRNVITQSISKSLKNNNTSKMGGSINKYLPYTIQDLINHLESKFQPGMTLENHGVKGWHIDHIKPVSLFNVTSMNSEEFQQCWALENLQPLWWYDNLAKSDYYEDFEDESLTVDELLAI